MTRETPFFFRGPDGQLFGYLHEGADATARPLLLCHPFGEEKLWTHRVFVTFARALAERGHSVLRFDYRGNGDSDGSFLASSIDTAVADAHAAFEVLKERTGANRAGVLGLRFGAVIAKRLADERDDVSHLVLWQPVVNGDRYLQELLRINLSTQMAVYREIRTDRETMGKALATGGTVNVDGYEISGEMSRQLSAVRLDAERPFAGRCLIVQIDRAAIAAAPEIAALRATISDAATVALVREEPFWKEIPRLYERAPQLFAATLQWLEH
jgi:exosortase A-associated hydrolase 2